MTHPNPATLTDNLRAHPARDLTREVLALVARRLADPLLSREDRAAFLVQQRALVARGRAS